jgi:hypothetical protein
MSDLKVQIQANSAKNKSLLETLAETDHAAPALEQHRRFLESLKWDLEQSSSRRARYDNARKAELRDHEDWSTSRFKKFAYRATGQGTKFQERASKEEREYFDALQKLHEEEKIHASLTSRVAEAQAALGELENVAQINGETQRKLDALYASIFEGPTPQFPGDDEREARSNQAQQAYHGARVRYEADGQVVKLLNSAVRSMQTSLRSMEDALSASRADIFGVGGSMADMMERNHLSQAERYVHDAQLQVMQAQKISPHVGDFPRVAFVQQSFLGDVLFDNVFSDMAMHDKLKDGRMDFERASVWAHDQLAAARDRHRAAGDELKARQGDLENARRDLQKFREGVFERVVGGGLQANNGERPPSYAP